MSVETIFDMGEMPTCPVCGKPANKMVVWGIAY